MPELNFSERTELINQLHENHCNGNLTAGHLIKEVRKRLYGMTQTQYARFCGVSDKTLRDVERSNTDPRISVMNKLLRPGGFQVGAQLLNREAN